MLETAYCKIQRPNIRTKFKNSSFGFLFDFYNLIVRVFCNLDIAMFAFVIVNVMPVTNWSINPYHHVSAPQTRHSHVWMKHLMILNSFEYYCKDESILYSLFCLFERLRGFLTHASKPTVFVIIKWLYTNSPRRYWCERMKKT